MVPQQTARNMLPNFSWKNCFVLTLSHISPLMRPILLTGLILTQTELQVQFCDLILTQQELQVQFCGLILTQTELQVQFCVTVKVFQHLNDQTAVIKLKSPE